jgi:hypothetical protein
MDDIANGHDDFGQSDLGDENPNSVDPEQESEDEYSDDISELSPTNKLHSRSMKRRARKRANPKPTRPNTYMGQRGNRRNRREQE